MENAKNIQENKNGIIPSNENNENVINHQEDQNEIINNYNNQELSLKEKLIEDYGFYANINGEDFDPREVSVLSGDEKSREITQLIKFIYDSYPIEAINYVYRRCFYKTFSRKSILDKIIKYLITKYEDKADEIITKLMYSYEDNILNIDISTVNDFNKKNEENFGDNILHMTKLVFYDYSKEGVEFRKFSINEIFIEIDSKYINNKEEDKIKENEGLTLEENDDQAAFLGDRHHLFKRFCRRKGNIYVFNFVGFENKKIKRRPNKKNKKNIGNKDEYDGSCAIFKCENELCDAVYTYNFSSNSFSKKEPHSDIFHEIRKDAPGYYQQNIEILKEKLYITDIQLVKVDE